MDERVKNYFEELSSINLNNVKEKKNNLDYISWAWAWARIKERYPDSNSHVYETENGIPYFTDGRTAWVKVGVTVNGIEHIEYLPIMDNRNRSIPLEAITSMDMNKTIQRATVKAIARHGLGLYVYAGEDLPEDEKEDSKESAPAVKPRQEAPKAQPQVKPELDAFSTREQFIEALVGMGTDINKLCVAFNADSIDAISTEKLYEAYCRKFYQMHRSK